MPPQVRAPSTALCPLVFFPLHGWRVGTATPACQLENSSSTTLFLFMTLKQESRQPYFC